MYGFLQPKITYAQWLQATYHDIIYDDGDSNLVQIINVPLFKCTIMMDEIISSFVGCIRYCDRPINGYKNPDEMISDLESVHVAYSKHDKYGDGVIWAHPKQHYKTVAEKLYSKKGKKVNHVPLWYKSKLIQKRINACWNPKYLAACFNAQYLSALCIGHHGIFYMYFICILYVFYMYFIYILSVFYEYIYQALLLMNGYIKLLKDLDQNHSEKTKWAFVN